MNTLISREQDYALRIVAYLAGKKTKEPMSVKELSSKLAISKSFTARIVHKLKNNNVLGTIQGKYGGVFLKADPKKLSLLDVLKIVGFNSRLNACLYLDYKCPFEDICNFHKFFIKLEKQILNTLEEKKISEFQFFA